MSETQVETTETAETVYETEFKVGDIVTGRGIGPNVVGKGRKKLPDSVNIFVGEVIEVEPRELSDVDEEIVTVRYTKPSEWDKTHGITDGHHMASEISKL